VDNLQQYVWACHLLGYQHPDLTLHAAQLRDWYGSEDGLDLRGLDADCAALQAAVAATEHAVALQDDQLAALSAAWQGRGADGALVFLRRHGDASADAAATVRTAADTLTALRDDLWQLVDRKVAAVLDIDDRSLAERADWLAAAHTVTTGTGDRAVASELIDERVKPFVDNDVRSDWLTAMRTAIASIAASYDAATAGLTAPPAVFDVPGDLGPAWSPPDEGPPDRSVGGGGVTTAPTSYQSPASGWNAPSIAAPMAPPATPPPVAPVAPPVPVAPPAPVEPAAAPPVDSAAPAPAMPSMPAMPSLGGGLPAVGSGLSGLGQLLADALSGPPQSPDDALSDPPELQEPGPDEPVAPDEETAEETADDEPPPDETEPEDASDKAMADDAAAEEPAPEPADCPDDQAAVEPTEQPAPTPAPIPPPPEPTPPPNPTETPCEIAADELPQAGQ
jgi:hypothetical protein